MASNPMQRKSRLAFILGMLTTVLIAAVIIMLLLMQIKKVKKEKQDLIDAQPILEQVWVAKENIFKGQEFFRLVDGSPEDVEVKSVDSTMVPEFALKQADVYDNTLDEKYAQYVENKENGGDSEEEPEEENNNNNNNNNYDDEEEENTEPGLYVATTDISKGTIITLSMLEKNPQISESYRLVEYNMITLPSELSDGQYIDIRITLPNASDYVVISKKKVEKCNSTTIWMNLTEKDMLTLNCAIIESYMMTGTRIYAVLYSDATQNSLANTYVPNNEVMSVVNANGGAFMANDTIQQVMQQMRDTINNTLNGMDAEERASNVESGFSTEEQALKSAREEFLGDIGY